MSRSPRTALRVGVAGYAFIVLSGVSGAWNNIFSKLALDGGVAVPMFIVLRAAVAATVLLLLHRLVRRAVTVLASRSTLLKVFLLGLLANTPQSVMFNVALDRLPAGTAVLIFFTFPAFVAFLAVVLGHERMPPLRAGALALSLFGVFLVVASPAGSLDLVGVACGLGAAVSWALMVVASLDLVRRVPALQFSGLMLAGLAVGGLLLCVITGGLALPPDQAVPWTALGSLTIALSIGAYAAAYARIGAVAVAVGTTLEPALTVLLSAVVMNDRLKPVHVAGTALVVGALALMARAGREQTSPATGLETGVAPLP